MSQRLQCPRCSSSLEIQGYVLEALIVCPRCSCRFQAKRERPFSGQWKRWLPDPNEPWATNNRQTSDPAAERTHLLFPHPCHQCQKPILQLSGKASTTLECPVCHNRTSVYAVTFRCRDCSILLEAPTAQTGRSHPCPGCRRLQQVPANVLERTVPVSEHAADWFRFHCPSCWDHVVVKKTDVGQRAACPHCFVTLDVPRCGYQARETTEKKEPLPEVHCPRCALLIPMAATVCPLCGLDRMKDSMERA